MKKLACTLVIFVVLFAVSACGIAEGTSVMDIQNFTRENSIPAAGITLYLPEDSWIVTQDSTKEDPFFQMVGADNYEASMNDLRTNSVYFDAINKSYNWEIRVTVKKSEQDYDFRKLSQQELEDTLNTAIEAYKNTDLQVEKGYICSKEEWPFWIMKAKMRGRSIYLCSTVGDHRMVAITVGDVYAGSISDEKLEKFVLNLFDSMKIE